LTILSEAFLIRALIAGLGVAAIAGPIGCFIVWRRMAYFGETLAHASLLGVGLGLLFGVDLTLGVIATTLAVAVALLALRSQRELATDTLLGILSHGALAAGIVVASLLTWVRFDLMSLLFGDILTVSTRDILWVWLGGVVVMTGIAFLWRDLLALTVHEELATAEGVNAQKVEIGFVLLIAILIAVAMKIVGILLITALLIIPAAAARRVVRSPEGMAVWASIIGMIAVVLGLVLSGELDSPSGPSIVLMAAALFVLTLALPKTN
jgi:zinc transport system permease protein